MVSLIKSCFNFIETSAEDNRCTCFLNGDWLRCCRAHDYECADAECKNSKEMRLEADRNLFNCVVKRKHLIVACIMYVGVRIEAIYKYGFQEK